MNSSSDDQLREAIAQAKSYAEVLRRLGLVPAGGNYATLKRRIQALGVDTSHFLGMGWRRGTSQPVVPGLPLSALLVEGRRTKSNHLKRRLLREGLKVHRCEHCLRRSWNGEPIPLELDHSNGRSDDNRLSNLQLLCPNCHAQTPTYRARNIRRTWIHQADVGPDKGASESVLRLVEEAR